MFWTHTELARLLEGRDPLFEAGEGWSYADANYILAGLALETHAGLDLYDYCVGEFIDPLGLTHTMPSTSRSLPDLVQGHVVLGQQLGLPARTLGEDDRMVFNPQFEWAGGGWVSNSPDLARWAWTLWSGRLLGDASTGALTDWTATPMGPGDAYGLGTIRTLEQRTANLVRAMATTVSFRAT